MSEEDLYRRAAAQGGAFSTADAAEFGFSRSALRHRLASGRWRRLRRGLFAEAAFCDPAEPDDATPALTRASAALAAIGPRAAASHHTAALVLGLPTYGRVPDWVALTTDRKPSATCESLPWLRVRRSALPPDQVWEVGGLRATSPARTAVDIARGSSLRGGVVVLDSALRAGCDPQELEDVLATERGWPGVRPARRAFGVADKGSESPLESLAHVCQFEAGLPRPLTQVDLFDHHGLIGRVDDFWPDHGVVGESDGLLKYTGPAALRTEKLRQERLEQKGLRVVRVTWADVTVHAARTQTRYRAALSSRSAEWMVAKGLPAAPRSDHLLGQAEGVEGVEGRGWGA